MNKKIITLFLVVFCALSTIAISVWGKAPEGASRVAVEKIEFIDVSKENSECEKNDTGDKIILLERGTTSYQLEYLITPLYATDLSVTFLIISGKDNATIDEEGYINFIKEFGIIVRISSNLEDGKTDTVIIDFKGGNNQDIPDDIL